VHVGAAALVGAMLLVASPALAQIGTRPGPWALDIHGATSPLPDETIFYPPLDKTALVPTRGYGIDLGAHVYLFNVGASRVGLGANVLNVRGTTKHPAVEASGPGSTAAAAATPAGQDLRLDLRVIGPQVSFNFGTDTGWSYLSAGAGLTDVTTRTEAVLPGRRGTSRLRTINVGGGARWFIKSHLAFSFDVRMYRVDSGEPGEVSTTGTTTDTPVPETPAIAPPSATPGQMFFAVGAGISIR
jgi:hypothetical protein